MLIWTFCAAWTPPPLHGWRRLLLRTFGARIGADAHIYDGARVWPPGNLEMGAGSCLGPRARVYRMAPVRIGAGAIISQDAELCTGSHDISDAHFQLIARPTEIGARLGRSRRIRGTRRQDLARARF